jgi:hypothetical protein
MLEQIRTSSVNIILKLVYEKCGGDRAGFFLYITFITPLNHSVMVVYRYLSVCQAPHSIIDALQIEAIVAGNETNHLIVWRFNSKALKTTHREKDILEFGRKLPHKRVNDTTIFVSLPRFNIFYQSTYIWHTLYTYLVGVISQKAIEVGLPHHLFC